MPGAKKKKRFIDKKNAVTFRLVHRSQKDPLVADERAPQHVLVEQVSKTSALIEDGRSTAQSLATNQGIEKRKEEQRKYGILFDDDYDYLQHLKDVGELVLEPLANFGSGTHLVLGVDNQEPKLTLPSSVFASDVEEKIGLLNRAAPIRGPQPDLDPDIVAALDSDYDESDSEIDDDFVTKANEVDPNAPSVSDSDDEDYSDGDANEKLSASSCSEEDASFEESLHSFSNEETKSRFTNYSLTSSVLRRNEGLTLLDDRFEKIFEEYDEDQIGALDGDDTDGYLQSGDVLLENVIEHFKKEQENSHLSDLREEAVVKNTTDMDDRSGEEEEEEEQEVEDEDGTEDQLVKIVMEEPVEKWDCESIISTYSNLYNHPKLIQEPPKLQPIKISSKIGIPVGVLHSSGLNASVLKALDVETSTNTTPSVKGLMPKRSKDETAEEKRNRKRIIKEQRRDRRIEKKANTTAFKEEKKRQIKVMLNLQQNLTGIKLS